MTSTSSTRHGGTASTASTLRRPFELPCGIRLDNRLAKPAMSENLALANHDPSPGLTRLYRRWADSGAAVLISGNIVIDRSALGETGNVVIDEHTDRQRLAGWADAATAGGAHWWAQLNHPGRQMPRLLDRNTVAPSAAPVTPAAGQLRAKSASAD
jgi:2,4-dienoyl-CoA reductase-like NADH-dependent reductase (Old Yellow Enzyme family)